jgi:hypothetical protein
VTLGTIEDQEVGKSNRLSSQYHKLGPPSVNQVNPIRPLIQFEMPLEENNADSYYDGFTKHKIAKHHK